MNKLANQSESVVFKSIILMNFPVTFCVQIEDIKHDFAETSDRDVLIGTYV